MVYDRTIEDVHSAKRLIAEKVQKGIELSQEDISILERGTITYNTLNRIENKKAELLKLLNGMGYWNTQITNQHWADSKKFAEKDFSNLLNDIKTLKDAFFVYNSTPKNISTEYTFQNINNIEKILKDLNDMVLDAKSKYEYCGEFECGEK